MKKLYRDIEQRKVTGLCAGVAEYFEVDVNLIRLITLVVIVMSGFLPGTLAYFVASAFIPVKGQDNA